MKLYFRCLLLLPGAFVGCLGPTKGTDRGHIAQLLEQRMGQSVGSSPRAGMVVLPKGVSLDDPLTEDAALAIALWNNAAFQELLVDLQLSRADLVTAGLLPNPEVFYSFADYNKVMKYAFDIPIESLWLRPIRVAAAERENARVADVLAQAGLTLIRDVRQAYADLLLAQERVRILAVSVQLRTDVLDLAEIRLKNGDASVQEVATARIDLLQAKQDAIRAGYDVPFAAEKLRNLLGVGTYRGTLVLEPPAPIPNQEVDIDALTREAVETRPDALAAKTAIQAAQERARLSRLAWVRFLVTGDATSGKQTGHELSPAFRVTLPLFNRNQGVIARADAEVERELRRQTTTQNLIIQEVNQAYARYRQSRAEWDNLQRNIRPEVDAAIRRVEKAYKEGNANYLLVLETSRQMIDTLIKEAQFHADLRRSWAELERSIGRRLVQPQALPEPKTLPEPGPKKPMSRSLPDTPRIDPRPGDAFAAQTDLHVVPASAFAPAVSRPVTAFAVDRSPIR